MTKPTLLILAAGMGSRYDGLKQITPIGPSGEMIIDYSIHDAIKAGFGKVVFVIRENISEAFKEKFHDKLSSKIDVEYVNQELDVFTEGFSIKGREKPWGTGHAVLVAKNLIDEPFTVINADDYYGYHSFEIMSKFLSNPENSNDYSMVGFVLNNTLSEHGYVSRGVCKADENSNLEEVVEREKISKTDGKIYFNDEFSMKLSLSGDEIVSMNFWGFQPDIFDYLEQQFKSFLEKNAENSKAEFYIPSAVSELIDREVKKVKVLKTDSQWFGLTYKEDTDIAINKIAEMINKGNYPHNLY